MIRTKALIFLTLLGSASALLAEGGCPAGHYPHNTPQMRACIPMPGSSGTTGYSQSGAFWEDRWGAIAADPNTGEMGVAVGEPTKRKATRLAIERCAASGSKDCKVEGTTFRNQCAAIARGGGRQATASAATEKEAQERALRKLTRCTGPDANCGVIWSDCSLQQLVR